ncbi:hypothetical protein [Paraliomyxa miuraensis]|uniref:hypothetical protein n=1 Tax=Paraliomyxa miuraensis TaxID=376150 RepID=UPI002253808E|nr:hypothetical protein [Paraliomyxa miuraensis]MCX4248046.1 hypothetical protein [Paraliomyxa miuraensis]
MSTPKSTIADQGLDLLDGVYALIDVAFAHDLAVAFTDAGTHDSAVSLTTSLLTLLESIDAELVHTNTVGSMGALLGTSEPFVDALYELLLESGHHLSVRAVLAVLRARRPIQLAYAHLGTGARMGSRQPVTPALRSALRMATQALLANLRSFAELLSALDPLPADLELTPPLSLDRG